MAKSKLKAMAEAGNPWAIKTLKEAQERGRAAGLRGQSMLRAARASQGSETVVIELAQPVDRLTFQSAHDAELALEVLGKAGIAVKAAHEQTGSSGFEDIVLKTLDEMDDRPPWS